eukprot:CAMPEP_0180092678 /NCGR_PEP_ID=MMETSP0985-20121206/24654_1 /TAXON_ID=483367 /ORGANISM="non described non described, Strain CCMP 2436" /LENGTH=144 /DNA_ID=CAMNT_0022027685 /DNA_START=609 /DNA_END=1043 /DNA_ORIENTATION=+
MSGRLLTAHHPLELLLHALQLEEHVGGGGIALGEGAQRLERVCVAHVLALHHARATSEHAAVSRGSAERRLSGRTIWKHGAPPGARAPVVRRVHTSTASTGTDPIFKITWIRPSPDSNESAVTSCCTIVIAPLMLNPNHHYVQV